MTHNQIRYDILTQNALRSVVKTVLTETEKHGLPGEHHFFISFLTDGEGVKLPPRLLARFPKEMTIVLQHHFDGLKVHDSHFEVGLSFDGVMERIVIPFAAVKGFYDPSVEFGMQFETDSADAAAHPSAEPEEKTESPKSGGGVKKVAKSAKPQDAGEKPVDEEKAEDGGAQVLSLDRYRKK